ncbi:MAG: DUF86 domain-containing protein, partial [Desulfarculus sp.]
ENRLRLFLLISVVPPLSACLPPYTTVQFLGTTSAIPWAEIVATRNVLIHEYFGVDLGAVWKIVRDDLPALAEQLKKLLA